MRITETRGLRALTTVLLLGLAGCGPDLGSELAAEDEELLEATSALSYPAPGITYSRLTATNRVFHVVTAKLTNGRIRVRATRPDEVQQLTTSFARSVNAVVAINGDFFNIDGDGKVPYGLAVGDGMPWPHPDTVARRFFACDRDQTACRFDPERVLSPRESWMTNAVGAHPLRLVTDGLLLSLEEQTTCGVFCTGDHPRTALGLSADQTTLIVAVAEGRRSGVRGPTWREMGSRMASWGARNAVMLDGGGSTTMVVKGKRVNTLGDGASERVVANHLGLLFASPSEYSVVRGARIKGWDSELLQGRPYSVQQCKDACDARSWCQSFDYVPSELRCNLTDKIAAGVGLTVGSYFDYYERDRPER